MGMFYRDNKNNLWVIETTNLGIGTFMWGIYHIL